MSKEVFLATFNLNRGEATNPPEDSNYLVYRKHI